MTSFFSILIIVFRFDNALCACNILSNGFIETKDNTEMPNKHQIQPNKMENCIHWINDYLFVLSFRMRFDRIIYKHTRESEYNNTLGKGEIRWFPQENHRTRKKKTTPRNMNTKYYTNDTNTHTQTHTGLTNAANHFFCCSIFQFISRAV